MADTVNEPFGAPWQSRRVPPDLWAVAPGRPTNLVCGLPSRLRQLASRQVIARVLRQIKRRFPNHFARLSNRVVMIRPLSKAEFAKRTVGEWHGRTGWAAYREIDPVTIPGAVRDRMDEVVCGIVELPEVGWVTEEVLAASAAHEFGHACTRQTDIERRRAPEDEWGSEAAADWYAYKWGFGSLIARARKTRDFGHHGPGPGEVAHLEYTGRSYRLSRNFVYHLID
jgi:hypothetical protein